MTFFKKACASGNDFVIIDERDRPTQWSRKDIQEICHRKLGVGADQVLILREPSSAAADVQMTVYNADGSQAEQCGNGLRAITAYLLKGNDFGLTKIKVQSKKNAIHECSLLNEENIMVHMGWPVEVNKDFSFIDSDLFYAPMYIKIGNPHLVLWVKALDQIDIDSVSKQVQPHFEEGVNIHFVQKKSPNEIRVRHWERGVGETLSCGSGTVSIVFAGHQLGLLEGDVLVRPSEETLFVERRQEGYYLTGRVQIVFDGRLRIQR